MIDPYFIDWIEDEHGRVIEQAKPKVVCDHCNFGGSLQAEQAGVRAPRVMSAENHFLINSMMRDIIRQGTGRRALSLGRGDLAGKTGTTNDFRDAWFSGFARDVVTTVWVGFDDSRTLGRREAGSRAALPVWVDYMEEGLKGIPEREIPMPDNIVPVRVSPEDGSALAAGSDEGFTEYFKIGTEPELPTRLSVTPGIEPAGGVQADTEGLF